MSTAISTKMIAVFDEAVELQPLPPNLQRLAERNMEREFRNHLIGEFAPLPPDDDVLTMEKMEEARQLMRGPRTIFQLVADIKVGGLMPMRFNLSPPMIEYEPYVLSVTVDTVHRDTGAEEKITMNRELMPHQIMSEQQILELCMQLARDLYRHEVEELFTVDGHRLFDPHVPKGKQKINQWNDTRHLKGDIHRFEEPTQHKGCI